MNNIDLKQLQAFHEILRTGSLSRAAEALGVGQPAVSMSLRRLREHFGDPLFVRSSGGMAPTALALELKPGVSQAVALLRSTLDHRQQFDPRTSGRVFRIAMSDIGQVTALPVLLSIIKHQAPSIRIDVETVSASTPAQLESGDVDLAIGAMHRLGAGYYQRKLLDERFVCIADAHHSRIRQRLTLNQFREGPHLVINSPGSSLGVFEQFLASRGIERTITVRVPNFAGISANIRGSDYLAVVPERLGRLLSEGEGIRVFPLPFRAPGYRVMQHWHERQALDPGNRWLRGVMAAIFED